MRTVSKALFALCLFWSVGAVARPSYLSDPELTPGDAFDVTLTDICTPGYSKTIRAVTKYLRDQAFRNYGIEPHQRRHYQLDHLIPLAIGGSNSVEKASASPVWPIIKAATRTTLICVFLKPGGGFRALSESLACRRPEGEPRAAAAGCANAVAP